MKIFIFLLLFYSSQAMAQSGIDNEVWATLNNDAKAIWTKLLNCANNDAIEAKNIYILAKNNCDLNSEITILHQQVENMLLSSSFYFPANIEAAKELLKNSTQFEPLLTQIILEEASLFVQFSVNKKIQETSNNTIRIWSESSEGVDKPYSEIIGAAIEGQLDDQNIRTDFFTKNGKTIKSDKSISRFLINLYTILLLQTNSSGLWQNESDKLLFLIAYQPISDNNNAHQIPYTLQNLIDIRKISKSSQIDHETLIEFFRKLGSLYGLRKNIAELCAPEKVSSSEIILCN